jgi:hypothetical protein
MRYIKLFEKFVNEPILTPEDFPSKELMANFYKSDSTYPPL